MALVQVLVSSALIVGLTTTLIAARITDAALIAGTVILILTLSHLLLPATMDAASTAAEGISGSATVLAASVLMFALYSSATCARWTSRSWSGLGVALLVAVAAFGWAVRQDRTPQSKQHDRAAAMIGGAALIMYFDPADDS